MDDGAIDLQLLRKFCRGDAGALGALAERYEGSLLGLARGLLGGREDLAQDALQEAWIKVIRHARHFEGRSSVRTWLYRVVINTCNDVRTRTSRWNHAAADARPQRQADVGTDCDDRARLAIALERLPDGARLILLLCHHRGLTHEQAAEVLELPVGTLKSRLHAAMEKLRHALREGKLGKLETPGVEVRKP